MATAEMGVYMQGIADDWQATSDWVLPDGAPDIDFLAQQFGTAHVPVHGSGRCAAEAAAC